MAKLIFVIGVFSILFCSFIIRLSSANDVDPKTFLWKYGFMPNPRARGSKANMTDAVLQFQRFNNLEQTGTLNSETLRKMRSPRCGNPDIVRRSGIR
ncbi:CRE-ZMP-1 protein-like protein, partial [Dinothrombium tinctorium]